MNKKILITGGAGFIGSTLVRHIINTTDHSVVNVDKLTYAANLESLSGVEKNSRYAFEQLDICDSNKIRNIFNKHNPDVVMHLAAESHVDRSIKGPDEFIQTNIIGTYALLEEARSYWLHLQDFKKDSFRFHHISTDEVFGDLDLNDNPFTEQTSYAPSSPYSASKASSDHLVRAWQRTFNLPTIVTNCSNNYGPFQHPEKLIPMVISNALEGRSIPIYGNGKQIRDWLYVDDHAKALLHVALNAQIGKTYNIGGNNEIENIEVVRLVCAILDELVPSKLEGISKYEQLMEHVNDRAGHDLRYAIDTTKIANDLGWSPKETFATGIKKTVKWYIENSFWCNQCKKTNHHE